MLIRPITTEDNAAIHKIIQNSLESLGLAIPGSAYFDPQLGELYQYYNGLPAANYWVVEHNHQVVGGVGIAPFNQAAKVCELQKLYLSPNAQGLGLAKQLMQTALDFATQHYDACYLETMHALKPACRLYATFGFDLLDEPLEGSEHSAMDAWYLKSLTR